MVADFSRDLARPLTLEVEKAIIDPFRILKSNIFSKSLSNYRLRGLVLG
jgi:hypothetical protein